MKMKRYHPAQSGNPRYKKGDLIGGRFQVHEALMGGMGEVYLGLDSGYGAVAL